MLHVLTCQSTLLNDIKSRNSLWQPRAKVQNHLNVFHEIGELSAIHWAEGLQGSQQVLQSVLKASHHVSSKPVKNSWIQSALTFSSGNFSLLQMDRCNTTPEEQMTRLNDSWPVTLTSVVSVVCQCVKKWLCPILTSSMNHCSRVNESMHDITLPALQKALEHIHCNIYQDPYIDLLPAVLPLTPLIVHKRAWNSWSRISLTAIENTCSKWHLYHFHLRDFTKYL